VQDASEASGYTTVTVNSDWTAEREKNYLRMVRRNRFDGLIINPTGVSSEALHRLGVPVVILGSGDNHPDFDSVGSATESAVQDALEHFLALGHRRIALIAGRSRRRNELARYLSYRTFHERHHLPMDEALVIECEFSERDGYESMLQLMLLPQPPTAIFAANDLLAIGALKAAQALHKNVPADVSIIGMDDIYAASMTSPSLTTIAKPKYEIGVEAARFLLERLNGNAPTQPRHLRIPCQFVLRGSTSAAPA
jgi:LacI family transcriptional regulator